MSFVYPRVVSFSRPGPQTGIGAQPYGGETQAAETPIASGVTCSIQGRREGTQNPVNLPGDARQASWYVFIPRKALPNGTLLDRDIMTDEFGERYQIVQPYWDSLGYRLTAMSLEA